MIGILADDRFQLPATKEFIFAFAQMQSDIGTARGFFNHLDGVIPFAAGFPADSLVGFNAGTTGNDRYFVGNDEGRIETDAKLADQVRILGLIAGQRREKFLGARLGDGAQMLDRFVTAQADAVVGNGDGARFLVESDANFQITIIAIQSGIVQGFKTQLVAGVGGVGNQLAQENLLVAVQGVNHQLQ